MGPIWAMYVLCGFYVGLTRTADMGPIWVAHMGPISAYPGPYIPYGTHMTFAPYITSGPHMGHMGFTWARHGLPIWAPYMQLIWGPHTQSMWGPYGQPMLSTCKTHMAHTGPIRYVRCKCHMGPIYPIWAQICRYRPHMDCPYGPHICSRYGAHLRSLCGAHMDSPC